MIFLSDASSREYSGCRILFIFEHRSMTIFTPCHDRLSAYAVWRRHVTVVHSMARNEPFGESTPENYAKRVDAAAIARRTTAARDTALDETVIRDARGGIPWPRCMIIIPAKKAHRRAVRPCLYELPGDYRMSGGERILYACYQTLSTTGAQKN